MEHQIFSKNGGGMLPYGGAAPAELPAYAKEEA